MDCYTLNLKILFYTNQKLLLSAKAEIYACTPS